MLTRENLLTLYQESQPEARRDGYLFGRAQTFIGHVDQTSAMGDVAGTTRQVWCFPADGSCAVLGAMPSRGATEELALAAINAAEIYESPHALHGARAWTGVEASVETRLMTLAADLERRATQLEDAPGERHDGDPFEPEPAAVARLRFHEAASSLANFRGALTYGHAARDAASLGFPLTVVTAGCARAVQKALRMAEFGAPGNVCPVCLAPEGTSPDRGHIVGCPLRKALDNFNRALGIPVRTAPGRPARFPRPWRGRFAEARELQPVVAESGSLGVSPGDDDDDHDEDGDDI
jgi:hypothetical protein